MRSGLGPPGYPAVYREIKLEGTTPQRSFRDVVERVGVYRTGVKEDSR